jgi:hypothetical protein
MAFDGIRNSGDALSAAVMSGFGPSRISCRQPSSLPALAPRLQAHLEPVIHAASYLSAPPFVTVEGFQKGKYDDRGRRSNQQSSRPRQHIATAVIEVCCLMQSDELDDARPEPRRRIERGCSIFRQNGKPLLPYARFHLASVGPSNHAAQSI